MKDPKLLLIVLTFGAVACSPLKDANGHRLSATERRALRSCDEAFHKVAESPFEPVWASETLFSVLNGGERLLRWPEDHPEQHSCITSSDGAQYLGGLKNAFGGKD